MNARGQRVRRWAGGALVVALPLVAAGAAPSNVALGEIDAIVTFCTRLDPKLAADGDDLRSTIERDAASGARGSKEYRQGYDLVTDALKTVDRGQALSACGALGSGTHRQ